MSLRAAPVRAEPLPRHPDLTRLSQVVTVDGWRVGVGAPLAEIRDLAALDTFAELAGWRDEPASGAPPFSAGAVGYLSDDLSPTLLGLPAQPWEGGAFHPDPRPCPAPVPPVRFTVHDTAVCVAPDGQAWITAADLPGYTREPADVRTAALRDLLSVPRQPVVAAPAPSPRCSLTEHEHADAVERILGWIAAGDLYQLNLTLQVAVPWTAGGAALAERLWSASPGAAHAALLRLPDAVEVVSVSPETFLRCEHGRAVMRPIKGTRPRGREGPADAAEAAALLGSAKDRSEHIMIVDLVRNDLGAVCEVGSVEVAELAALTEHPTLWHLTSTVHGDLPGDIRLSRLLAATFPCGSVTGAPKRMAVARTTLVEPVRRGVYCGAIGVVTRGLVELSVAIRTAVVHNGVASYGTGGGIVADSEAPSEWAEAMAKASAFLAASGAQPVDP